MAPEDYDVLVLGSGEGGKFIAWTLAKEGQKVAVIEREYIGGSCPNIACLPSKNIIHSAKVASYFSRGHEFGMRVSPYEIDMSAIRQRKRMMVKGLVDMHLDLFKQSGAELIKGMGQFIQPKTIQVVLQNGHSRIVRGKKIIISTGSRARIAAIPGINEAEVLTHIEALELDQVPGHLIVMGGGYVGLELAQAMCRFGSQVTIIERNTRLVHREDEDVSEALMDVLKEEGIAVITGAEVVKIEGKSGQKVLVHLAGDSSAPVEGTHLLAATGRTPNTQGIGLENAGVEVSAEGYVKVNDRLETSAPDVWAVGDCAGSPHFTHIAFDDYRTVCENMAGRPRVTSGRQVPFCLFTDPEFARVGFSESEAKTQGIAYKLTKIPSSKVLRTRTLSETRGFMKALIDPANQRILGFTVFGVGAGELIATVQVAMLAKLPFTVLRDAIFTHPTLQEGLITLFANVSEGHKQV